MKDYATFLESKRVVSGAVGFACSPESLHAGLFPFQRDIVAWALRRGRAAIWADCGLGKTWMALEWARHVVEREQGRLLILTPLAVAPQFREEGEKLGLDVTVCREPEDLRDGINVTNYDRLDHFDAGEFCGVVLDESSCLKDYTSATRNALIESFAQTPFKLACTATPAPNDFMELGNHAEFLGVMSRSEMLSMFFVHDGGSTQDWRLKGHAEREFWRWIASWAVNVRKPSDLGYEDGAFELPALRLHEHVVRSDASVARDAGLLFTIEARTLDEQRAARRATLPKRVARCASLVNATDESFLVWCDLNDEGDALEAAIPGAVQVTGSQSPEVKEAAILGFRRGEFRVLISKPSICGHGVNFQICRNTAFVGLSHSFEAWYQAIRRTWRFGQTREVNCHMISSDIEGAVADNLRRKQIEAERLGAEMAEHVREFMRRAISKATRDVTEYKPGVMIRVPAWLNGASA